MSLVFLAHAGLNDRVPGNFGVTAFFFLSGYLITTLMRIEFDRSGGVSMRAFYLRRVLRIFPPMYLVLTVASLLTALGVLEGALQPRALLAQVFYLSNYYIVQNGWWDGRAPGTWILWSLAVEEHFYLVFPLMYVGLRRLTPRAGRQAMLLLGLCALVLIWRLLLVVALGADHDRTYVASDTRIDSILFGCVLAVYGNPVLDSTRISHRWWKLAVSPLGLVALLVSFLVPGALWADAVRYTVQGVALLALFPIAIRYHDWAIFRVLNVPPMRFLGLLSYSIYLLHPTVLFAFGEWTTWPALVRGSVSFAVILLLATLIHRYVEKPCSRLRRRLSRAIIPAPHARVAV